MKSAAIGFIDEFAVLSTGFVSALLILFSFTEVFAFSSFFVFFSDTAGFAAALLILFSFMELFAFSSFFDFFSGTAGFSLSTGFI